MTTPAAPRAPMTALELERYRRAANDDSGSAAGWWDEDINALLAEINRLTAERDALRLACGLHVSLTAPRDAAIAAAVGAERESIQRHAVAAAESYLKQADIDWASGRDFQAAEKQRAATAIMGLVEWLRSRPALQATPSTPDGRLHNTKLKEDDHD